MSSNNVVVVGAGFGGLTAARALGDANIEVEIVDRRNHHLFQPLLFQVATAGLEPSDVAYAVRGIAKRQPTVSFAATEIVGADLERRILHTAAGRTVPYDQLILAAGAKTASFGIDGVEEHSFELKSLDDALKLRRHVLEQFERCAADPQLIERGALNIVVVGGGPTGVEMAGAFSELFDRVMRSDFPELDLSRARIELIEMSPQVLGPFAEKLQRNAQRELRKRGVILRLGQSVRRVTADGVELDSGEVIDSQTCIWAAGVEAEPLGKMLGLDTAKANRIVVDHQLRVPGRPEIFVIGDLAAATDKQGDVLPQLAPVAMQQARYVAEIIKDLHAPGSRAPFVYVDKGTMATIGRRSAVAQLPGGIKFTGSLAWVSWLVLHIYFLVGFRSRVSVMLNWAWNYVTWDRAARVVVGEVAPQVRDVGAPQARDVGAPQVRDDMTPQVRDVGAPQVRDDMTPQVRGVGAPQARDQAGPYGGRP